MQPSLLYVSNFVAGLPIVQKLSGYIPLHGEIVSRDTLCGCILRCRTEIDKLNIIADRLNAGQTTTTTSKNESARDPCGRRPQSYLSQYKIMI